MTVVPLTYSMLSFASMGHIRADPRKLLCCRQNKTLQPDSDSKTSQASPLLQVYGRIVEGLAQAGDHGVKALSAPCIL